MRQTPEPFDITIVARTGYAEGSGEGPDGMLAICWSIGNRYRAQKWYSGETLADCCLFPLAYSSWNVHDPNRRRLAQVSDNDRVFQVALACAQAGILQRGTDPTGGATHYHDVSITPPDWAKAPGAEMTKQIGRLKFYKGIK